MQTKFLLIAIFILFTGSAHAIESSADSYISFDKLNESLYSIENEDKILGLGFAIKSTKKLDFIIAYEGGIYNEKNNVILSDPTYKVSSFINSGALSYKLNYKF